MKYLISNIAENAFSRPVSVRPGNRGFRQKPATPLGEGPSGRAGQDFSFYSRSRFVLTHGRHMVT